MGAVQQPFLAVGEVALEQLSDQAAVARVGYRNQQFPGRGEDVAAGLDNAFRPAQVFQHIGADDIVVTHLWEDVCQYAVFEIGHLDPAVIGASDISLGVVVGQPVHSATERFLQVFTQGATAGAQVQHRGPRVDQADQD